MGPRYYLVWTYLLLIASALSLPNPDDLALSPAPGSHPRRAAPLSPRAGLRSHSAHVMWAMEQHGTEIALTIEIVNGVVVEGALLQLVTEDPRNYERMAQFPALDLLHWLNGNGFRRGDSHSEVYQRHFEDRRVAEVGVVLKTTNRLYPPERFWDLMKAIRYYFAAKGVETTFEAVDLFNLRIDASILEGARGGPRPAGGGGEACGQPQDLRDFVADVPPDEGEDWVDVSCNDGGGDSPGEGSDSSKIAATGDQGEEVAVEEYDCAEKEKDICK